MQMTSESESTKKGKKATAHSSMTRERQEDPLAIVQPPSSNNAIYFSPNATPTFQCTPPIPKIGAVIAVLSQVVKSVQVRVSSRLSHYSDSNLNMNFICT